MRHLLDGDTASKLLAHAKGAVSRIRQADGEAIADALARATRGYFQLKSAIPAILQAAASGEARAR